MSSDHEPCPNNFQKRFEKKLLFLLNIVLCHNDGSGTRNLGFGIWKCCGEMGLMQIEQGFSSFFAKEAIGKKREKPCSSYLKPIFWLIPGNRKSDFEYPIGQKLQLCQLSYITK